MKKSISLLTLGLCLFFSASIEAANIYVNDELHEIVDTSVLLKTHGGTALNIKVKLPSEEAPKTFQLSTASYADAQKIKADLIYSMVESPQAKIYYATDSVDNNSTDKEGNPFFLDFHIVLN